jgi:hypothetical protein
MSIANVPVTIFVRSQSLLRVVGVDQMQAIRPHELVELREYAAHTDLGRQIVAGGIEMRAVETYAYAIAMIGNGVEDRGEFLEGVADQIAGAGGTFQ